MTTTFLLVAGVLFAALLIIMSIELFTQYAALEPRGEARRAFPWEREITGKFLLLALVIVSLVFDLTVYVVSQRMPGDVALLDNGYLMVTIACELWLLGAQMAASIANIRERVGAEHIPPIMNFAVDRIRLVLTFIRSTDQQRLERSKSSAPPHRWYDHLTADDIREIQRRVEARAKGQVVAEPPTFSVDRGDLSPDTDVIGKG